jgi:hypothetical protein
MREALLVWKPLRERAIALFGETMAGTDDVADRWPLRSSRLDGTRASSSLSPRLRALVRRRPRAHAKRFC